VLLNPGAWSFTFVVVLGKAAGAEQPQLDDVRDGVGAAGSLQRYEEFLAAINGRSPKGEEPRTATQKAVAAFENGLFSHAGQVGGVPHVYLLHAGDGLVFEASAMPHGSVVPRQVGNAARAIAVFHSLSASSAVGK
jgi:hypothetical protein